MVQHGHRDGGVKRPLPHRTRIAGQPHDQTHARTHGRTGLARAFGYAMRSPLPWLALGLGGRGSSAAHLAHGKGVGKVQLHDLAAPPPAHAQQLMARVAPQY